MSTHIATNSALRTPHSALSNEQAGYIRYLYDVLARPLDDWGGFYTPRSQNANFALRYQIAFAGYAIAALATLTPAYRQPYAEALRAAIMRMTDYATWRYWQRTPGVPHDEPEGEGYSPDPLAWGNVQYAGHLSTLLGLYGKISGDTQFAEAGFTLSDGAAQNYHHTHHDVAATIHQQMRDNQFHGVPCEPGCVYLSCNNHSMSSNLLHDQLFGTDYASVNAEWVGWLRENMLLGMFPTLKHGLFNVCYMSEMKMAVPVSFNFTDGWGIGLLAAFDRELGCALYPQYRKAIKRVKPNMAYVPTGPMTERMEVSDRATNTAFGYVAARELGDMDTAERILAYAHARLDLRERDGQLACWDTPRTLYVTALFALGSVPASEGAGWSAAVLSPYDAATLAQPMLEAVLLNGTPATPHDFTVTAATYDATNRALNLTISPRRVGELSLRLANVERVQSVQIDGDDVDISLEDEKLKLGSVDEGKRVEVRIGL